MTSGFKIYPFAGLVPPADKVAQVSCVPYDVVDELEARSILRDQPQSLIRVDRAEVNFPEGTDPYHETVYAKAHEIFKSMQAEGFLQPEPEPCMYVYRQSTPTHTQAGIVALCSVEDYEKGLVKKHEKTRPDKEDDRTRLIDSLSAQTSPIFLTFRSEPTLASLINDIQHHHPLFDERVSGVRHTLWRVEDWQSLQSAFQHIPCVYIADGHHRAASAARVAKLRRERGQTAPAGVSFEGTLSVLFPSDCLSILPYNRCVKDLNGMSEDEFLKKLCAMTSVMLTQEPQPSQAGSVAMFFKGAWHSVALPQPLKQDPVSVLDVSVLQDQILAPLLGIDDPRTNQRISFVGGIRGTEELERRVNSGDYAVAFSMFPVTVEQMMNIADADQIMPPKSTWFEPKLRSGYFIHTF